LLRRRMSAPSLLMKFLAFISFNKNSTALMDLGDKYARRFDYEKAEKPILKD